MILSEELVMLPSLRRPTAAEEGLLLCCARVALDDETSGRIKTLLQEDLDWEYVLKAASLHCIMPLLYRHLSVLGTGIVPPAVLERLKNDYQANAQRNLILSGDLHRLLRLLKANDIPVVPLKGPVLAATVYGDVSLRQFGDLDVLLRKRDIARAKELLISHGYRPAMEMTAAQESATLRHHCEYLLVSDNGRVIVELHWRIIPSWFPFPLNGDHLLSRLTKRLWVSLLRCHAEDLMLIICVTALAPGRNCGSAMCGGDPGKLSRLSVDVAVVPGVGCSPRPVLGPRTGRAAAREGVAAGDERARSTCEGPALAVP
jgi:hypothetical protein